MLSWIVSAWEDRFLALDDLPFPFGVLFLIRGQLVVAGDIGEHGVRLACGLLSRIDLVLHLLHRRNPAAGGLVTLDYHHIGHVVISDGRYGILIFIPDTDKEILDPFFHRAGNDAFFPFPGDRPNKIAEAAAVAFFLADEDSHRVIDVVDKGGRVDLPRVHVFDHHIRLSKTEEARTTGNPLTAGNEVRDSKLYGIHRFVRVLLLVIVGYGVRRSLIALLQLDSTQIHLIVS